MFTVLMPNPKQQFFDNNGLPLIGGLVYTYDAGTSNPRDTFTDEAGTVAQPNPIPLNARGEPASAIRWSGSYRVEVHDAWGNLVYTVDNFETPISVEQLSVDDGAGLIGFNYSSTYIIGSIGRWLQDLSLQAGSSIMGFIQSGFGANLRTVESKLREQASVTDYMTDAQRADYLARTQLLDLTVPIQAAMDAHYRVYWPDGAAKITAPLRFRSYTHQVGESKGGIAGRVQVIAYGAFSAFESATLGSAACFHPIIDSITINNSVGLYASIVPGSIGVDFEGVSFGTIKNCSLRFHEIDVNDVQSNGAGYYNSYLDNEVSSGTYGYYFGTAGNSNKIIGGRISTCKTGVYGELADDNTVICAIENCETGIDLGAGTAGWHMQCRWEGCGDEITTSALISSTRGAAVRLGVGSASNHVFGFCSGGNDRIFDLSGENFVHIKSTGYSGVAQYGRENMFYNESCEYDSDGNGIADGLALSAATPAGTTMTIDATDFVTGAGSQLYTVALGGSSQRNLNVDTFPTTIGVNYSCAVRVKTNKTSGWSLRAGSAAAGTQYLNAPIVIIDEWAVMSFSFTATTTSAFIYFYTQPSTVAGGLAADAKLWVDAIYFGIGLKAPEFGVENLRRRNFVTYNPPSLAAGAEVTTTVACAGVALGDFVSVAFSLDLQGVTMTPYVSAANVVTVVVRNGTAGVVDLGSGTLRVQTCKAY